MQYLPQSVQCLYSICHYNSKKIKKSECCTTDSNTLMSLVLIVRMSRSTFDVGTVQIFIFASLGKLKINNHKWSCPTKMSSRSPIMPNQNVFQKPLHISSLTQQGMSKTLLKEFQMQPHAFQKALYSHACAQSSR